MVNAADGGGGSGIYVNVESVQTAIGKLQAVHDEIEKLKGNFASFQSSVKADDWSTEPGCRAFGQQYTSALAVYHEVIGGMQQDLAAYVSALTQVKSDYTDADDASEAALLRLGGLDEQGYQQDRDGRREYEQPDNHPRLDSDKPQEATDTTPGEQQTTTLPGGDSGSGSDGSGASGQDRSGQDGSGQGNTTQGNSSQATANQATSTQPGFTPNNYTSLYTNPGLTNPGFTGPTFESGTAALTGDGSGGGSGTGSDGGNRSGQS